MADSIVQLDRYDRQLRIWGSMGQELLDKAHICLIGPHNSLLRESLRNLVLLGVSKFSWVAQDDVSDDYSSIGAYSTSIEDDIASIRPGEVEFNIINSSNEPVDYCNFDLVIKLNAEKEISLKTSTRCNLPPTITVKSAGFYGFVKLALSEPHLVLDPHNEHPKVDLRLDQPWSNLKKYLDTFKMAGVDLNGLIEYPYPIILNNVIQKLMSAETDLSTNAIKKTLKEIYGNKCLAKGFDRLNYLEAQRYASRACGKAEHDRFIVRLNSDIEPYILEQYQKNANKWSDTMNEQLCELIIKLTKFVNEQSLGLPLQGKFPDMESDHNEYQKLKDIYDRHKTDYMTSFLQKSYQKESTINGDILDLFCSSFMDLTILKPLTSEGTPRQSELYNILSKVEFSDSNTRKHDEFSSISKPSLFPVDTFLAGLASQEAIKLITHQFIPIDNTFVYDGLKGEHTETLRT
ncbi:NEDD8-activating enzyme E1 regulatory subunit [Monosporozyma servazzii]